jgi:ribosomal protein S12 methylthiotransferase accessory factor
MEIEVRYPGGVAVDAVVNGQLVQTDQPPECGGQGIAPSPFDLFLASIATCAGYYALLFCRERSINPRGLRVGLDIDKDPLRKRVSRIRVELTLPEDFPEKYRPAIVRAVDQCTVKKHLAEPPDVETVVVTPVEEAAAVS